MEDLVILVRAAQDGYLTAYGEVVRRFQDMAYGCVYRTSQISVAAWVRSTRTIRRLSMSET